ncbi:MAG: hypothetical protein WBF47_22925 [Xanthobacteraceae bacterium]
MRIPATIACHHLRCKARGELVRKTHSIDYLPEGSRDKVLLAEQRLKRSTREPSEPLTIPRVMKLKKLEVPASINSAWFWRRLLNRSIELVLVASQAVGVTFEFLEERLVCPPQQPAGLYLAERRFYFPHLQFGFDLLASALIDRAARIAASAQASIK